MRMGDKLLKILGSVLLSESRKADIPCRIGAKQLAVIMPNTGEAAAREAKERVNMKIESVCDSGCTQRNPGKLFSPFEHPRRKQAP